MEVFIQVMESGNFTRAADALGMPRSTVSTVIQALEDRVGTQLLRRSTRQMMPTDEGQRFLRTAREIVDAVQDTDQMFRGDAARFRGKLRVDMPSRIGRRIVIPALPALLDENPELEIEVSTTDRKIDLISEGIDCLIRVGTLHDADIICRTLGDLRIITCASPGYLERHGTPQTASDLSGHWMVNYGPRLSAEPPTFCYEGKNGLIDLQMRSRVAVNNAESYIAAARAGLGLIQLPAYDVRYLLKREALVQVLPKLAPPPMQLSLLYAERRNVPARIIAFREWVQGLFRRKDVI
ncbi:MULTISPECIES: LysR family transcriptional regulator [unclassified Roseovarius]|uniref:LysR family transcriptional regulator n=1 Tax=unclassified Roseovarius TaxID=2614913 RepID=UPI00273FC1F1|nr:LysR family transcriptional regulator [Roseovarius sp. MMSF_3350]